MGLVPAGAAKPGLNRKAAAREAVASRMMRLVDVMIPPMACANVMPSPPVYFTAAPLGKTRLLRAGRVQLGDLAGCKAQLRRGREILELVDAGSAGNRRGDRGPCDQPGQ